MHVITRVRAQRAAVVSSVAALALVGCGEALSQSPAQRVQDATSNVFDTESLTVSLGLDLDDDTRAAIIELVAQEQASSEDMGSTPGITSAAVERLLDSRIVTTMATTDGSKLSDLDLAAIDVTKGGGPRNVSSSVSFVVEGDALVEVRQVDGILYARVDTAGLGKALDQPGLVDEIQSYTTDAPPALADAAASLASGDWVSLDTAELLELPSLFEGLENPNIVVPEGQTPTPTEATAPDTGAITDAVEKLLSDAHAVITREIVVSEEGDDAYRVTAPLDRILRGLAPSLKETLVELTALMGEDVEAGYGAEVDEEIAGAVEALEGRKATLDVTLAGERLSTVRMDVAQFLSDEDRKGMRDDGVTGLPVLIELAYDGTVQTPDHSVELDMGQVMEGLMGSFMGLGAMGDVEGFEGDPGAEGTLDPFEGMAADDFGMTEEEFEAFKAEMAVSPTP